MNFSKTKKKKTFSKRIIFFGSKNVGLVGLKALCNLGVEVLAIVSTSKSNNTELYKFSLKKKIYFFNIFELGEEFLKNFILKNNIHTAISISYPKIINESLLSLLSNGGFNFHPAKLPKYRGCFPTIWPILFNDKYAHYTLHLMDNNFDTGPIVNKIAYKIKKIDTGWSLYKELEKKLPLFIKQSIEPIFLKKKNYKLQNNNLSNYYPNKLPNEGFIDLDWNGDYIVRFVRSLYSPVHNPAKIRSGKKIIYIKSAEFFKRKIDRFTADKKNIALRCKNGYLLLKVESRK